MCMVFSGKTHEHSIRLNNCDPSFYPIENAWFCPESKTKTDSFYRKSIVSKLSYVLEKDRLQEDPVV